MIGVSLLVAVLVAQAPVVPRSGNGVVGGQVRSFDGTPAAGVRVAALEGAVGGGPDAATAAIVSLGKTDAAGNYRLTDIPPGRYFVLAGPLDLPTYFPGSLVITQATPITVAAGANLNNIDFRLAVAPDLRVRGRVLFEGTSPVGAEGVEVVLSGPEHYETTTDADGLFEFRGIRPGAYQVQPSDLRGKRDPLSIVVKLTQVTGLELSIPRVFRVAGRVVGDGASQAKPNEGYLLFFDDSGRLEVATDLMSDGSFDTDQVKTGTYDARILFGPLPLDDVRASFSLRRITVAENLTDLKLTLPEGFRVSGRLIRDGIKTDESHPILVRLYEFGGASAKVAADGSFEFLGVPSGTYKVMVEPQPVAKMPLLTLAVSGRDVTGIQWVIPDVPSDELRGLLQSADPLDQAWGAWMAGQAGKSDLIPLLEQVLAANLARATKPVPGNIVVIALNAIDPKKMAFEAAIAVAIDTAADALIRLDAKPPVDILKALSVQRPAQSLILMSRLGAGADPALFSLLETQQEMAWFAAANLLLDHRAPGFAAALLKDFKITAQLWVCNSGGFCGDRGRFIRNGVSDGISLPPSGAPPWPTYELDSGSTFSKGDALSSGPVPVFIRRTVLVGPAPYGSYSSSSPRPRGEDRMRYLAALVPGLPARIVDFEEQTIQWKDSASLETETAAFRQRIEARYSELIAELVAAVVLTPDEAAAVAKPNIEVVVTKR